MGLTTFLADRLGFGTGPLGNAFRAVTDEEASATLHAAWDQGIRFYDTAPMYGAGLAELRLGELLLSQQPRDSYVLCTKVGRLVLDEIDSGTGERAEKGELFAHGRPNKIVYDYSADGTQRSVEDSLKRNRGTLAVQSMDRLLGEHGALAALRAKGYSVEGP